VKIKIIIKLDRKFIKNKLLNMDRNIILPYSERKIIANPPLLYSVLNPETSSDSPSAKSKGARLVSATSRQIQHNNHIGFIAEKNQVL
jgi:hypothetical protein